MQATQITNPTLDQLSTLNLERNALELETVGYTVVEDVIDPDLTKRGLEATLRTFEERTGSLPDVASGEGFEGYSKKYSKNIPGESQLAQKILQK